MSAEANTPGIPIGFGVGLFLVLGPLWFAVILTRYARGKTGVSSYEVGSIPSAIEQTRFILKVVWSLFDNEDISRLLFNWSKVGGTDDGIPSRGFCLVQTPIGMSHQ